MGGSVLVPYVVMATTAIASFIGFDNQNFRNQYLFNISAVRNGQYYRYITSGFLHADIQHLLFNMISLYFFAQQGYMEIVGNISFLIIYFGSIIAGNMLSYLYYKNQYYYSALGASGGVTGVIFSFIAFFPTAQLGVFFIIPMSAWLFAIVYIAYSYWASKNANDNIGHTAHLGGALFGLFYTIATRYDIVFYQWSHLFMQ